MEKVLASSVHRFCVILKHKERYGQRQCKFRSKIVLENPGFVFLHTRVTDNDFPPRMLCHSHSVSWNAIILQIGRNYLTTDH
jgi:hypothetical protein